MGWLTDWVRSQCGKLEEVPEPVLSFAPQKKGLSESSKLTKTVLELLSTLGTAGTLIPGTPLPVKAGIASYKEGLRWTYMYLANQSNAIERLVDVKIERALATSTIAQVNAELVAIQSRLERMEQERISTAERAHEVVPALHSCEKILTLFRDENYTLWRAIIPSTETLTAFVPIYADVIKKSSELTPSYQGHLNEKITLLKDTLEKYKHACVKERINKVVLKCNCGIIMKTDVEIKASDVISKSDSNYQIRLANETIEHYQLHEPFKLYDNWDSWQRHNWREDDTGRLDKLLMMNSLVYYCNKLTKLYEGHIDEIIKKLGEIKLG